ncbi:hypothetical protein RJ639_027148 [Escallonia herrerae]|uniref:CYTH domain-containing protein n=1 Tax=Escallonia herrerae TaxID=1293975 RepID=A0AA89BGE3_9ASTE|nr:hypothetical protein RJ639_027148 [Escallonia herrerae]
MEVEVKLRLPDPETHQALLFLLAPFHVTTHRQHNAFFDGAAGELSSRAAVLRLRFYDGDSKCVASLKAKSTLVNGISRVEEDEEEIDPQAGRACVFDPNELRAVDSRVVKRAREEFQVGERGFVGLGGFDNVRGVYEWEGLNLEVDETMYDFGTCYEVECESTEPEKAKDAIERLLRENGICFSDSVASKFAIFRSGKMPYITAKVIYNEAIFIFPVPILNFFFERKVIVQ